MSPRGEIAAPVALNKLLAAGTVNPFGKPNRRDALRINFAAPPRQCTVFSIRRVRQCYN